MADLHSQVADTKQNFPAEEPGPVKPCPLASEPAKKPGKTWVEVRLIDMAGKPVAGAKYKVRVPGETKAREGKLDENGRVNFRELDPGMCDITFPDYDYGAWARPAGRWPIQRAMAEPVVMVTPEGSDEKIPLRKTWVEFRVVDSVGKPAEGLRYRATLPGESEPRTGTLDKNGSVSFHKIDPGMCTFTLPDYDYGAWTRPAGLWPTKKEGASPDLGAAFAPEELARNGKSPAPEKEEKPQQEKTWVEFVVIDMAGKPAKGVKYRAELPGESEPRTGVLDASGKVSFHGIDPGTCRFTLPDYDEDAWARPAGRYPTKKQQPGEAELAELQDTIAPLIEPVATDGKPPVKDEKRKEKTWVEFALIDMAGKPVAGAKYRVQLPGEAKPRTGVMDKSGRVSFHEIDPGMCSIQFPDFDKERWEPLIAR